MQDMTHTNSPNDTKNITYHNQRQPKESNIITCHKVKTLNKLKTKMNKRFLFKKESTNLVDSHTSLIIHSKCLKVEKIHSKFNSCSITTINLLVHLIFVTNITCHTQIKWSLTSCNGAMVKVGYKGKKF